MAQVTGEPKNTSSPPDAKVDMVGKVTDWILSQGYGGTVALKMMDMWLALKLKGNS